MVVNYQLLPSLRCTAAGCSPAMAQAISQRLRAATKQIVSGNPYSLIGLVASFRFHDAEQLAAATGFDPAAPQRAAAALRHELLAAASSSSITGLQWDELQQRALATMRQCSLMPWPEGLELTSGAQLLLRGDKIVIEELLLQQQQQQQGQLEPLWHFEAISHISNGWTSTALVTLKELHNAEQVIVSFLLDAAYSCNKMLYGQRKNLEQQQQQQQQQLLGRTGSNWLQHMLDEHDGESSDKDGDQITHDFQAELSEQWQTEVVLNEGQQAAVKLAMKLPVLVLTGGPGCGKTLTSQVVARAWLDQGQELAMAAPTGGVRGRGEGEELLTVAAETSP
jgi:hypothetical protein